MCATITLYKHSIIAHECYLIGNCNLNGMQKVTVIYLIQSEDCTASWHMVRRCLLGTRPCRKHRTSSYQEVNKHSKSSSTGSHQTQAVIKHRRLSSQVIFPGHHIVYPVQPQFFYLWTLGAYQCNHRLVNIISRCYRQVYRLKSGID